MAAGAPGISPDTEVVLLLCAHFEDERGSRVEPLGDAEYAAFARWLRGVHLRPADLTTVAARARLSGCDVVSRDRIEALLARGGRVAFEVERWVARGLWVAGRGDPEYPSRWKLKLGDAAPPLAYGVGDGELLRHGGLGIVGAHEVDETSSRFTRRVAIAAVRSGMTVICGGARGVDRIAVAAALGEGGTAVGVPAGDIAGLSVRPEIRDAIVAGRLALVSAASPRARFATRSARTRNGLLYSLCDSAVVVRSGNGTGGTWSGAVENLERSWTPLFVHAGDRMPAGNAALIERGASALEDVDLESTSSLRSLLAARFKARGVHRAPATDAQPRLPFGRDDLDARA